VISCPSPTISGIFTSAVRFIAELWGVGAGYGCHSEDKIFSHSPAIPWYTGSITRKVVVQIRVTVENHHEAYFTATGQQLTLVERALPQGRPLARKCNKILVGSLKGATLAGVGKTLKEVRYG
jgi:hypothetical protein